MVKKRCAVLLVLFGLSTFGLDAGHCFGEDIGEARARDAAASLVGTAAPDIEIALLSGDTVKLKPGEAGKPVYLKFWATWCIPCREQMAHLQSVYEKHGDDIDVIAINVGINESLDTVRAFQKDYGISMPIAFDSDGHIGRAFDLTVTPQHVLIDGNGTIRYVGHLASEELDGALESLLSEQSPAPATSAKAVAVDADPEDTIALMDGTRFSLDQPSDLPTVLFFFATWCDWYLADTRPAMSAACVAFQEKVSALHGAYGDRFRWVGIAQSLWTNADDLSEYQARLNIGYPLALDTGERWFSRYGIRDVPTIVILDTSGEAHTVRADELTRLEPLLAGMSLEE